MISVSWLKKRQPYWARLESLLADIKQNGLRALGRDELRELGLLYRQTATDLSAVRGDTSSVQQSRYLNQLLGRAHNAVYSGQKKTFGRMAQFFWNEYPLIFRQYFRYTLAATGIFVLGGLAAYLARGWRKQELIQTRGGIGAMNSDANWRKPEAA